MWTNLEEDIERTFRVLSGEQWALAVTEMYKVRKVRKRACRQNPFLKWAGPARGLREVMSPEAKAAIARQKKRRHRRTYRQECEALGAEVVRAQERARYLRRKARWEADPEKQERMRRQWRESYWRCKQKEAR